MPGVEHSIRATLLEHIVVFPWGLCCILPTHFFNIEKSVTKFTKYSLSVSNLELSVFTLVFSHHQCCQTFPTS